MLLTVIVLKIPKCKNHMKYINVLVLCYLGSIARLHLYLQYDNSKIVGIHGIAVGISVSVVRFR